MTLTDSITQERVKELLYYSVISGQFYWLENRGSVKKGDIAGTKSCYGYLQISIDGIKMQAHRIVFLYIEGKIPKEVDHINHDRAANMWINLRPAKRSINMLNKTMNKNNTTGQSGVFWYKPTNKWKARISNNGSQIHLGYFSEKEDAIKARKEAEIEYGYHPNHGSIVEEIL